MFVENYDVTHYFSAWLKTGSNLADINQFRSYTGKCIKIDDYSLLIMLAFLFSYKTVDFFIHCNFYFVKNLSLN